MNKIYIITTAHPADDVRIYHREILSLVKKYPVVYLAPNSFSDISTKVELISNWQSTNRIGRSAEYFKYLKKQDAKIIHFHDIDFAPFAIVLKYLNKAKVVFDKHEFAYLTVENRSWAPSFLKPILKYFFLAAERFFCLFCDDLIVANPKQLEHDKNATLLLNVPPLAGYPKFNEDKDFTKICYIGDVTVARGGEKIIEIAGMLPKGYEISVIGRIRDQKLEGKMKESGINLLGYVPNDQLLDKVSGCGIGLIPFEEREQYKRSVPSKMFDYLALGMLVVAADFTVDSFGEGIVFEEGVSFVKNTAKAMAESIKSLAESPSAGEFSRENRITFEKKYNWSTEEQKLFGLYSRLIGDERK